MKIGIIIWRMSFSGAENVANALIGEFRKQGHDVHVLLTSAHQVPTDDCKIHNVTFEGHPIIRIIKRSIAIRKIALKEKFDVVVGFGLIDSIHIIRALFGSKIIKVACERMDPATYPFKKHQRIERDILYRALDGIILQTTTQEKYYNGYLKVKTATIPNPVRNPEYMAVPINDRKHELVTVARLDNKQKNHIFMFQCFEEFIKTHSDYVLKLYGDGPDKKMYEEYIASNNLEDKIILCGRVDTPQKYIKDATAFLLTSNHEGMPNALIEAMAMGLPCITTDCGGGGAKDLVVDGENGFITPIGDKDLFVKRLCELTESTDLQNKIGTNAKKLSEKLSIGVIAQRWIEAFRKFQGE